MCYSILKKFEGWAKPVFLEASFRGGPKIVIEQNDKVYVESSNK
jgi:hypothetical protein